MVHLTRQEKARAPEDTDKEDFMEVTDVRMTLLNASGATKAIGTISFNGELAVRGIRVMESSDGRNFISFPSRQRADGQYDDIAFPLNKDLYHAVSDAVIKEFNILRKKAKEEEKEEFLDVSKAADENPDQVFMESPREETKKEEAAKEDAPRPRKGRGR